MEELKKYLQQFPNYTSQVYENLEPLLTERILKPGELLLRQGKTSNYRERINFILSLRKMARENAIYIEKRF